MILSRSPTRSRSGFTLVEIVLTIAVFGISVIAVVEMLRIAILLPQRNLESAQVSGLAQAKMEETLGKKFADIKWEDWTPVPGYPEYETTVSVTDFEPQVGKPVLTKKIQVTIRWGNGQYSETLTTLKAAPTSEGG